MSSQLGHPLNSPMEINVYGYKEHMFYAGGYHKSNDETRYPLATHQTLERKKTSIHIHQKSYFDIKWSFLICSRDKADRHTPILIEDENLFTAFNDLPLDNTWNKRDPEPYQDINVLLFLGLGENPQINLLGQVINPNNHSHETMNTYLEHSSHSKSMFSTNGWFITVTTLWWYISRIR